MSQRKKTPDILGDLLGSKPVLAEPVAEPVKPQNILPAKQQDGEAVEPQESLPLSQQSGLPVEPRNGITVSRKDVIPPSRQDSNTSYRQNILPAKQQKASLNEISDPEPVEVESKTKMTFYLSEDSVELLEEAQRTLRRMAKKSGKVQPKGITSKSALLEEALKLACDDLEAEGENSRFASLIT